MQLSIKALALSGAIFWGGAVFLVGVINLAFPTYALVFLQMIASIYPGYVASRGFGSVIIGTMYAFIDGGIGGALLAWLYNHFI
jgi:hypothetical protein